MPFSINGVGTGLVKASKARTVEGYVQYDAVEAFMLLYLPLIPYKAIHVLGIWNDGYQSEKYQSFQLKSSGRLIAKALLNGWSNWLLFVFSFVIPVLGFALSTMSRPLTLEDWMFLSTSIFLWLVGVILKMIWYVMNGADEHIKDIIGPHELGTSDPFDWPDEVAQKIIHNIQETSAGTTLFDKAKEAYTAGDKANAMFYLRLVMRVDRRPVVVELYQAIVQG